MIDVEKINYLHSKIPFQSFYMTANRFNEKINKIYINIPPTRNKLIKLVKQRHSKPKFCKRARRVDLTILNLTRNKFYSINFIKTFIKLSLNASKNLILKLSNYIFKQLQIYA